MSSDRIIEHLEGPYHRGHAPHTTHTHAVSNPLCGDMVRIELEIEPSASLWVGSNSSHSHPGPLPEEEGVHAGVVRAAYFDGVGCRISQAAASMLVEHVEGRSVDDIKRFSAADMLALFGPRLTPLRQRCCLLAWQALQVAIFSPIASDTNHE
jgi:nitrogen fixation NifU-like protein